MPENNLYPIEFTMVEDDGRVDALAEKAKSMGMSIDELCRQLAVHFADALLARAALDRYDEPSPDAWRSRVGI